MSRYSRVRGPAANFEFTAVMQTVTGMSITRHFGNGILDISFTGMIQNFAGAAALIGVALRFDGVEILGTRPFFNTVNNDTIMYAQRALIPISAGIHTVDFQGVGIAAVGEGMGLNTCELIVVELPEWDSDDDIITL